MTLKTLPIGICIVLLLNACDQAMGQTENQVLVPSETRSSVFIPQKILPDNVPILTSLPDFNLVNQNGAPVNRDDLYNQLSIFSFTRSDCKVSCATQLKVLSQMGDILIPQLANSIRFVSLSDTPELDTPEALSAFINTHDLNVSQWDFLTGSSAEILKLAKNGFNLPVFETDVESSTPMTGTTDLFLVDWEGRVRGQYNIIDASNSAIKNDVLIAFKKDLDAVFLEQKVLPESLHKNIIDPRAAEQMANAKLLDIFTDFTFRDKLKESGITFQHKIVDDVAKDYKAIHYDHGSGMAIADVDMDGLEDIYFTTLSGTNELWRNLGGGTFENITLSAGLTVTDRIGMGASFADIDNDGDPDLYITNVRVGNILFENDGKGNFTNITASSGTNIKAHSSGAVFFDYDRDGLLDLFVTNVGEYTTDELRGVTHYSEQGQITTEYKYYVGHKDAFAGHLKPERNEESVLFRNLGNNKFEDVSAKVGLIDKTWSGDATIIDGNNDGWPDLYVISMQGNDEYYENQEGRSFLRKSREVFPKTSWGAMGVRAFDYDNDGDIDLYVTDMHSDMRDYINIEKEKLKNKLTHPESFLKSGGNSIFGNSFYRNDGNGKYTEISDQIGVENYWPWGPSSGDLNADGYEDLFVASSMSYPFRYHINSVLLNKKGDGFADSEFTVGVEPRRDNIISKPWFEIDCESADKEHLVCVNSSTKTSSRTIVWGALGTRSAAIFDLDNDGDQDIVTLEFNNEPMVLINDLSEQKEIHYIKFKLQGKTSNRSGIGAKIRVYAGEDIYTKVNDGKSGYLGQSDTLVYFGLGDHKKIDKIEITWPSGKRQTLTEDLPINELMQVAEP